jgi:hypothetical protein
LNLRRKYFSRRSSLAAKQQKNIWEANHEQAET